jgi:hypothetical protein
MTDKISGYCLCGAVTFQARLVGWVRRALHSRRNPTAASEHVETTLLGYARNTQSCMI